MASTQDKQNKLIALEDKIKSEIEAMKILQSEKSLAEFTKQAWHLIEPETKLKWNWHLDTICGYLEATIDPTAEYFINRLIINVPPGSLKSILVSVMYPAWMWIKHPAKRVLGISNIQDLSIRDSRRTKIIITSEWFQDRWTLSLMADQSAKTNYENSRGGFRGSLGMTGNITGKRGDCLLLDDPHDATTVQSDTQRSSVLDVYDSKLSSRVNDQATSVIILIMQRLHHQDLTGHLLSKKKTRWVHVVMPMHYDKAFTFDAGSDLGRPELDDPRKDEQLLFPAIFPHDVVEKLEEDLGEYHCTPAETPITLTDMSTKRIEDIEVGDKILGFEHRTQDWGQTDDEGNSKEEDGHLLPAVLRRIKRLDPKATRPGLEVYREDYLYPKGSNAAIHDRFIPNATPYDFDKSVRRDHLHGIKWTISFTLNPHLLGAKALEKFCKDPSAFGDKTVRNTQLRRQAYERHLEYCERHAVFAKRGKYIKSGSSEDRSKVRGVNDFPKFLEATVTKVFTYDALVMELTMTDGSIVRCTKDHLWYNPSHKYPKSAYMANCSRKARIKNYIKIIKPEMATISTPTLVNENYLENISFVDVAHAKPIGRKKVYALETTSGNYVAWGLASSNSAGQLEQRPSPKSGGILRQAWYRILDETVQLPVCDHVFVSCDTAYSERDRLTNSYSAFTTWGVFWNRAQQRDCILLLDVWFDRVDYPDLRRKAMEINKEKKPDLFLIEKKASGLSLVQDLQRSGIFVRTYTPTTDKVSRAYAIQAMLESGQVWIPDRKWAHHFAYLMGSFPTGVEESNDLADTFTQAALYIRNGFYVTHPDDEDYREDNHLPGDTIYSAYGGHLGEEHSSSRPSLPASWNTAFDGDAEDDRDSFVD